MAGRAPHRGRVTAFDEERGYGTVEGEDGRALFFHCTGIADGSRTVAVGADVVYLVVAGAPGRWEAAGIVKL
jgi:cold shock CspA family protein